MDTSADTIRYATIMLAAGLGIPILGALNSALGVRLGSPAAAASFLFVVAFLLAVLVMTLTGSIGAIKGIADAPKHQLFAGCFVAIYVLSITWVAPNFGVGNAIFFALLGQLISAAIIDHFGLMGAKVSPISLTRAAGISIMAFGILLTQRA